jgi:hypothetical protein
MIIPEAKDAAIYLPMFLPLPNIPTNPPNNQ